MASTASSPSAMSAMTTLAPSAAKRSAPTRPRPDDAPVMRATLPDETSSWRTTVADAQDWRSMTDRPTCSVADHHVEPARLGRTRPRARRRGDRGLRARRAWRCRRCSAARRDGSPSGSGGSTRGPASTTRTRRWCGGAPRAWRSCRPHPMTPRRCAPPSRRVSSTWTYRHRMLLAATVTRARRGAALYDTHLAVRRHRRAHRPGPPGGRARRARRRADRRRGRRPEHAPRRRGRGDPRVPRRPACATPAATRPTRRSRRSQRLDYVLRARRRAVVVDQHTPEGGESWAAHQRPPPAS